jgi:hypothetical protein
VSFFEFVFSHHDTHQCQFAAEIYYFRPVRSGASTTTLCTHTIAAANSYSVIDVPCGCFLHPGRLHGDLYSSLWDPALSEPRKSISLIRYFVLRSFTGTVQQERKCFHCDHGKRFCQLCLRYRSSRSPAVSEPCLFSWKLLIFTKDCITTSRQMLSPQCSYSFLLNFLGMRIFVKVPAQLTKF